MTYLLTGIRFAKSPTSERRFQPATVETCPSSKWVNATSNPPGCLQSTLPFAVENLSEDCLFLNIWTKGTLSKPKPVIFWLYGGSNIEGSVTSYHGLDNLARQEDICLIASNYRVSVFGFLASPALALNDTRGISGNYGITDIIAALQWVQTNGAAFGCDSNVVTIYGQSSGGTNILALLASPSAKGLFHAAIALSPSANITQNLETTYNSHKPVISETSCADLEGEELAKCLRTLPATELLYAVPSSWIADEQNLRPGRNPSGLVNIVGLLAVDGVTITKPITEALAAPIIDVPLYLSSMRDEEDFVPNKTVIFWTQRQFQDYIYDTFSSYPQGTIPTLIDLFGRATVGNIPQTYYDMGSQIGINCAMQDLAQIAAGSFSSPVYVVEVDLPPTEPASILPFSLKSRFPFHIWDWIMIHNAWDFASPWGGDTIHATHRDLIGGKLLREELLSLSSKNHRARKLVPYTHETTSVNVLQESGYNSTIATWQYIPGFRAEGCQRLKQAGFDQRFYWIN